MCGWVGGGERGWGVKALIQNIFEVEYIRFQGGVHP